VPYQCISTITSCSRRDNSVAVAANGIGREGGDGSAQRGQSAIYDFLVYFEMQVTPH